MVVVEATDARLRSRLQSTDVTVLTVEDPARADPVQELTVAGKEMGFPGVLVYSTLDADLRYEASYEAFVDAEEYAVPARVSTGTAETELIAGIPVPGDRSGVEPLVTGVRDYVDTVVVAGDGDRLDSDGIQAPDVSVVDAGSPSSRAATVRALFDHVDQQYAGFEALVVCDGHGVDDPGVIPALIDGLSSEGADLVVGRRDTDATPESESFTRRVEEWLVDALTMGSTEQATGELRPAVQALSPEAVTHIDIDTDDGVQDVGSAVLDRAIRADLDVHVIEPATAPGTATTHNPEAPLRARDEVVGTDPTAPEDLVVGAESDVRPLLSVVIPTKNEEEGIETCLGWVYEAIAELQVPTEVIVSDSSTDRTPEIAREWGAIVVEPDAPGYGYAYRYAFERVRGEYVAMGDADTTYDFSEIPRFVDHLDATGADLVLGSRLVGEIEPGAMPALHQYVGNPLLTRFLNRFYDAGVSDAHSGFRVFTREALAHLDLESDGMEFASEMIMDASVKGLTIEEVPITYHERVGEETLDSFRDGWRHVRFMLINAPGHLFSGPAVAMIGVGLLMLALSAAGVSVRQLTFSVHTAIAGSLLTIVGYQVGTLGVFSTIAADPIKKPPDRLTEWVTGSVRLEHGLVLGLGVFALGAGYAAVRTGQWLATGQLPLVVPNLLAFTAIVVGLQTVFTSFFLSVLATERRRDSSA